MKKTKIILSLILLSLIILKYCHTIILHIHNEWIQPYLMAIYLNFWDGDWAKLTITTFVGGLLSYAYVMYRENKREARDILREHENNENEKKEKCTTALLNTQMTISFQMDELKGLEQIFSSIINFKLSNKTLEYHLKNVDGISAKVVVLRKLVAQQPNFSINNILKFTYHLIITPPINTVVTLPQEIFNLPLMKFNDRKLLWLN